MCEARLDAPSGTNGASGSADVAADGDVSAEGECTDRIFTVEDDDKIRDIRADLETPAYTTCRDAGRGRPRAIG